jgi:hypothetical protein
MESREGIRALTPRLRLRFPEIVLPIHLSYAKKNATRDVVIGGGVLAVAVSDNSKPSLNSLAVHECRYS